MAECIQLSSVARQDCLLTTMWLLVTGETKVEKCREHFEKDPLLRDVCDVLSRKGGVLKPSDFPSSMRQVGDSFVFLSQEDGETIDINLERKKYPNRYRHPGGWTWSSRFADLDRDGYIDIFNAEGTVRQHDYGFNVFMHNILGGFFQQRQFTLQLTDSFNLFSYVFIDYDRDGDLDIIGNSSVGPVQVYENRVTDKNGTIQVSLRDFRGNRFGLGAKVYLSYRDSSGQEKQLVRELKASGGYMSFDEPSVFFGIGSSIEASKIRVKWPDQHESRYEGSFPRGAYVITRDK